MRQHRRLIQCQCNGNIAVRLILTAVESLKHEAQLMLTNQRDAFRSKSRSPNMVPFHRLGMVSD